MVVNHVAICPCDVKHLSTLLEGHRVSGEDAGTRHRHSLTGLAPRDLEWVCGVVACRIRSPAGDKRVVSFVLNRPEQLGAECVSYLDESQRYLARPLDRPPLADLCRVGRRQQEPLLRDPSTGEPQARKQPIGCPSVDNGADSDCHEPSSPPSRQRAMIYAKPPRTGRPHGYVKRTCIL